MATAYNQELVHNIDIIATYQKLMMAATGQDSIYLKAKETLQDMYDRSVGLDDQQRAALLSQGIIDLSKDISARAMEMALKIDTENRDAVYALTKLREDTKRVTVEIAKTEKDIALADKSLWIATVGGWKAQAEAYRDFGVQTWNQLESTLILPQAAYVEYGTKVETLKKAKADIYQGYAQGFRTNGYVSVVLNADGSIANTTAGDTTGLTYQQTKVAIRQEKAFEDNKKQHVVNSSASLMSTLLATETAGIDYTPYLTKWTTAVDYLNTTPV